MNPLKQRRTALRRCVETVLEPLETRRMLAMTHQYTFNNGTANDSVGSAHATLVNSPAISDGVLWLRNGNGGTVASLASNDPAAQYAQFPTGVLPTSGSATIEVWYSTSSYLSNFTRVFDFGDQVSGAGNSYFFYTPRHATSSGQARAVLHPAGSTERIASTTAVTDGFSHVAAIVVDTTAGQLHLYLDGALAGSTALNGASMASISSTLGYLGKSLFDVDPAFSGAIDEVRIYNEALSATTINAHYGAGPTRAASTTWRQVEELNRGVNAIRSSSTTSYVSWRMLASDPGNIAFNVYRAIGAGSFVKQNATPITKTTDLTQTGVDFTNGVSYYVTPVIGGVEGAPSETYTLAANTPVAFFRNVPLQIPADGVTPAAEAYTYSANDTSVGDVDGDGEYELIVKWEPSNAKDNSQSGYTGNVYVDAYKLDGTQLWRIDLGRNIRAGAHYTQFQVYDLDGDGRAEVAMKTAPGTIDGAGNPVLMGADLVTADYRNTSGYILTGPEYLTVFNGLTGANMSTVAFQPARGSVTQWGDSYGNRVDRFTAAVGYLDGQRPSLIMGRGYYGPQSGSGQARNEIAAYDFRNGALTLRWHFKAGYNINSNINSNYIGQGPHGMSIADVDNDGKDEVIYGASAINDNGAGLYSTGWGHGDAFHVSDLAPTLPGIEVYMVHEDEGSHQGKGGTLRNGNTGALINYVPGTGDVGRGVSYDIDPRYLGAEMWNSSDANLYNVTDGIIYAKPGSMHQNFGIQWDSDAQYETLDGTTIGDFTGGTTGGWARSNYDLDPATSGTQGFVTGGSGNNGTKNTPALTADLYGDYREEMIVRRSDNSALMIMSTPIAAKTRMTTLMHDLQYREAVSWQNSAYNQPPHTSFYFGDSMAEPVRPQVYFAGVVTAPTSLSATPVSTTQINLAWTHADPTETGFRIEVSVNGGAFSVLGNAAANATTFSATGLTHNTNYAFRVIAVNGAQDSDPSNTVASTPQATGSIAGVAFDDTNGNAVKDGAENFINARQIYIDTNNNGSYTAGEPTTNTNGSGAYSFTQLPAGTYVIRQQLPNGWAQTYPVGNAGYTVVLGESQAVSSRDFASRIPPPSVAQISLFKPVRASSHQSEAYGAPNATDSNAYSHWRSASTNSEWITIDLGQVASISRVALKWGPSYGVSYDIQVSNDESNWTTLHSTTTGDGGTDDLVGLIGTGRYVRMLGSQRSNANVGFSLYDFSVYGPALTPPSTGSISGKLFWDANANGVYNAGESAVSSKFVWLDSDNDAVLDSTEWSVLSTSQGDYRFDGLAAGDYRIRRAMPNGQYLTTPAGITTLGTGSLTGVNIGAFKV